MPATQPRVYADRTFDTITQWILPFGLFAFLCGMFILPGRGPLQTLYYLLLAVPTLAALLLRPRELLATLREPIVLLVLALALWAIASVGWSDTDDSVWGLAKRPLIMLLLFPALALIARHRLEALPAVLSVAAPVTTLATGVFLVSYIAHYPADTRLVGGGAFDNPLLSAHLFGFFCVYWLHRGLGERNLPSIALCVLGALITFAAVLATGSRTPLVALSLAVTWLALVKRDKRSIGLLLAGLIAGALVFLMFHQELLSRGSSYRFDIWKIVAGLIAEHPWIGHGYDAALQIDVNIGFMLAEPHNFALGALFYLGIIGFIPWAGMQLVALWRGLQLRHQPLVVLGTTWVVFGIGSGLTEGGGVFSRPNEHWYLLWLPLAWVAAVSIAHRGRGLPIVQPSVPSASDRQAIKAGKVIEADGLGAKVVQLADGSFVKLFRARGVFTSNSFYPLAQRFADNCFYLNQRGISAPTVLALWDMGGGAAAVRYRPLPGQTVRQAHAGTADAAALAHGFGAFMAQVHELGIYFRSMHLGNVLIDAQQRFALIDVADMRLLPSPIRARLRQRNLKHIHRYPEDAHWLLTTEAEAFRAGYASKAGGKAAAQLALPAA